MRNRHRANAVPLPNVQCTCTRTQCTQSTQSTQSTQCTMHTYKTNPHNGRIVGCRLQIIGANNNAQIGLRKLVDSVLRLTILLLHVKSNRVHKYGSAARRIHWNYNYCYDTHAAKSLYKRNLTRQEVAQP